MDILYLLIPLSAVLVLGIVAVFGWAVYSGQFDDIEREGERLLEDDRGSVDESQVRSNLAQEESPRVSIGGNTGGLG
jgi:cbb3-type cytochrome oxidase maturation protein